MHCAIHPEHNLEVKTQGSIQNLPLKKNISQQINSQNSEDENQTLSPPLHSKRHHSFKKDFLLRPESIKASQDCPDSFRLRKISSHHQKEIKEEELQKKSTRSSLHEDIMRKTCLSNDHENSMTNINKKVKDLNKKQETNFHYNLETQGDVLPELIYSCKICLQASDQPSYDPMNNPICKVCNCHDYIHLRCLEEWITRRDIMNEEIEPYQCEVCLAFYQIDICMEKFLSFQIFCKNLKSRFNTVVCEFLRVFVFLSLSLFGIYLLGQLITSSQSDGGEIRVLLSMPYGTCITITVFFIFILLLVFGIFLYTWIMEFWVDFKFKIKVIDQEKKSNGMKLKKIFNYV